MTPLDNYDRDDPNFVEDLIASEEAVWKVARWRQSLGKDVTIMGRHVRQKVQDLGQYLDRGDLRVNGYRVEAKQRPKLNFTCAADYPYPTIFVDVAHTWDRADPKPIAYFILNARMTHAAVIIPGNSAQQWKRIERFDGARKRRRVFLECPLSCATFWTVP